jgi:Leucine-rich repeat (LRR) protein
MEDLDGDADQGVHWLRGQISSSLLALPHLKHLDLSGNLLGGNMSIPEFIGSLKSLTYLNLSNINLGGRVPPQLGNLTKLVYLDIHKDFYYALFFAQAYSSDVSWLASLHSLEHLDMSGVNLSSAVHWVHAVNNLPNLRLVYLSNCDLNSSTPSLVHHNLTVLEELDLSRNLFNSPAAPNWYWAVTSLKSLDISLSGLSGPFPDELGNLTMLETLDMGDNNINGMIPSTLQKQCSLRIIYLNNNNIGGDITDIIGRIPKCSWKSLQKLGLFSVNISGTTLNWVLNLTTLRVLNIMYNHLSGSVPVEIGTLTNLTYLYISHNSLSGVISEGHFSGLTNLKAIDLSHNFLQVRMDSVWQPPFNLERAYLSSCHLGSHVPNWLRWQNDILVLDISDAGLTGRIPDWFWTTFSKAFRLDLSRNQLTGELPLNLEFMSVQMLHLQLNHLTGSVPQLPRSIRLLDISKNSLNRQLPSNFGAPHLHIVLLFSNCITGVIPESICQWPQLQILDLSNNLLTRGLPDCGIKDLKQWNPSSHNSSGGSSPSSYILEIHTLLLNNNSLSGGFPLFLKECKNIEFLDLTQNKFSGTLPAWISEDMPSLVMLRLRSNNFSGHIPIKTTKLFSLRILDLANNAFSGLIPQNLENFKALTSTDVTSHQVDDPFGEVYNVAYGFTGDGISDNSLSLVIKGQVLDYRENVIFFMSIDLSCNRFTGQIPEEIGSLVGLKNLNLSSNFLSGNIPCKIGNLRSLESLDLSNNQLSGEIPWRLSNLTSLSYLNMSYNNLSSRIPSGHQLDTLKTDDPASMYIGNPGLCGQPLPKACPGDQPAQDGPVRWHEDGNTITDFHLSLIVGLLVGLWTIFCGLLFKKTWRYAYFSLFDKLYDKVHVFFVIITWQRWFRKPDTN